MELSANHMGASVASASDQQKVKRRLPLRRASSAVKLPPNPGSEGAKVAKKARALKRHGTRSDGAADDVADDVADDGAKVAKKARALKRHGTRSKGAADDVADDVSDDGAKVVEKARVLKRHRTPDLTNLCLKRAWFAATSLDGLSGVLIPTVKKKGLEYAAIAPTSSKWFNKLCFGVSYYKSINANATREVLLRIWRGIEQQLGEAPKDF